MNQGPDMVPYCDELRVLLGYLASYFPFNPARRDVKVSMLVSLVSRSDSEEPRSNKRFKI